LKDGALSAGHGKMLAGLDDSEKAEKLAQKAAREGWSVKSINKEKGITILMITHELDAIKYSCDRMAVLEGGKIIEQGKVVDIFHNPHSRTGELFTKVFFQFQNDEFQSGAGI
ncbi:MAG: hypothetical protein II566_06920, partial [Lachnospiraceae bacterium]|nr:hypothetical protein [Lachnospiraceae bacterium]